jgi:hypothetical protein
MAGSRPAEAVGFFWLENNLSHVPALGHVKELNNLRKFPKLLTKF